MDNAMKKYAAEFVGTFVLTLFGCGTAAIAGAAVGTVGIALAFGLSVVCMAFAIGNISGCHINPAVSLAVFLDKRMGSKDLIGYWVAQFLGGIAAAAVLVFIITNCAGSSVADLGLGCNGYEDASSMNITLIGAIVVEVILTCVFVMTILGVTADEKRSPFAGLVVGFALTFVHLFGIALTGTSVNPARSFGPALFMALCGGSTVALSQVWVFIVAPLVGAALAAGIYRFLNVKND
ncbi:aquaporin [Paratractidigestivibacter sp.]|uniref:aquaporin n=1 Tax=Paratractidigestivibacter sp. TaxID=2847316 RepID=UPI002ABD50F2|nr:aquaporin [Paratractidigestivibacter sp.]